MQYRESAANLTTVCDSGCKPRLYLPPLARLHTQELAKSRSPYRDWRARWTPLNARLTCGVQLQVNDSPPLGPSRCRDRSQFASIGPPFHPRRYLSILFGEFLMAHGDWKCALSLSQLLYPYSRAMMYCASSSLGSSIPAIGSNEWYRLSAAGSRRRNALSKSLASFLMSSRVDREGMLLATTPLAD